MRGSDKTTSIFSANDHTASEQGPDVRPTLDHLIELTCKAIVRAGRKGALPVKSVDHDEALRFGQAVRS